MTSQDQQHSAHYPEGRVDINGLLYGSVGMVLSYALTGVFRRADSWLFDRLKGPLFDGASPQLAPMALVLICSAVFCYGIAFAVLDSPGLWRRIVLGVTAVVLTVAMVPAFAVWNVYFSPFVQLVGVFWSWFCVLIYTQHHRMPCDRVEAGIRPVPAASLPMWSADEEPAQPEETSHPGQAVEVAEKGDQKYQPQPETAGREKPRKPDKKTSARPTSAKKKRPKKRSQQK